MLITQTIRYKHKQHNHTQYILHMSSMKTVSSGIHETVVDKLDLELAGIICMMVYAGIPGIRTYPAVDCGLLMSDDDQFVRIVILAN